ncbi:translocation/assembly module TamB [Ancylomarina salipaludis]|uniref:Translocation/assembly module TamB n=1 Tax=Ancylomarina salipaludis TaxID=2501299 RepID=A0A4Q1JNU2_9BACT|nr:translocation/assembly module TamB [Ancylomarina salipaludis]RXQ96223.1 translocation/assembly module TamB [Ancylomarina salipaludis]
MKKRKIAFISCCLILFLIGILLLYTQSNSFRNNLKRTIELYASQAIHGSLNIASLEGNIFSGIELHKLEVKDSMNNRVIYLHYLKAEWNLKTLIHKTLLLKAIEIDSLNLYIFEDEDHSISIQNLIKQNNKDKDEDKPDKSLPLNIDLRKFELERSTVFLNFPDSTKIPKTIAFNGRISAKISSDSSNIKLQSFNFKCENPNFEVLSLTTDILFSPTLFKLDNLELKTPKSSLSANAEIPLNTILEGKIDARFSPIALEEFQPFIDQKIQGAPEIKLNIHNENQASNFDIRIKEQSQNISLTGSITSLNRNASYQAQLNSKQFNLGHWLANNNLQTNINGQLFVKGQNLSPKDSRFTIQSQFKGSQMDRYPLDSMNLSVNKQGDSLSVQTNVSSLFGQFNMKAKVINLFDRMTYQLSSDLQRVDMGRIIQQKKLHTNINAHINLKGVGREPQKMESQLALKIAPSRINGFKINEAELLGHISQGNYNIDTLLLKSNDIDIEADGKGNINNKHRWLYKIQLKSLNSLSSFVRLPDINGTGQIEGKISGKQDSLLLYSKLHLSKFHYDTLKLESLSGEAHLSLINEILNGSSDLEIDEIEVGKNLAISHFKSEQTIKNNVLNGVYKIQSGDSIELNTHLRVSKKDSILVQVSQFSLNAFSQHWKNEKDTAQFIFKPHELKFTDVNFVSKDQYIRLNGTYSFKGEEDLKLELTNIQLAHIPELNRLIPYPLSGEINGNLILKGNASEPEITSKLSLVKGHFGTFSLDSLYFKFDYKKEQLKHEGILIRNNTTLLKTEAYLPVHLSLKDSIYLISAEKENYLRLKTTDLDLSQFTELITDEGQKMGGKLNTEIEAKIEHNKIDFKGDFNLSEGLFKMQKHGINYEKINLSFSLNKDEMNLDSLYIASGDKGYLSIKGKAKLPKNMRDVIHDINLHLEANNFTALKSYYTQLTFNADAQLKGSIKKPIISGGLTLVRSKINIDPFIEDSSVKSLDTPLLIAALEEDAKMKLKADSSKKTVDSLILIHNLFFKNLRGEFNIDIPKNTWVIGTNMQLELSGLIKMIKTKDEPQFFGNITLVRGSVEISGRRFKISKGDIDLRGGSEIDPNIDIVMNYKFRDVNRNSKLLELKISGTLKNPTFAFSLNNEYLEEKDAIAYLLFGKKMDELASSEQGQISSQNNQAKSLIYSQVSNLFQKLIAKNLGLDTIEISGEDNWETGAVTFGKYITNDLYMSYSQLFSIDSENKQLVPYRLIIEYHIIRSLLLQASNEGSKSGFDLLWKIKL